MGAWFLEDKGWGIFKPLIQWGKSKCQRENPSNSQLPSLSYSPNHLLLPEIGWVSYCMGWEMYGGQHSNWLEHPFLEKCVLTYEPSKCPFLLPIPSCIHIFGAPGHSPWMFLQCSSFFPWLGSVFVNVQWLGSLLGIFVLFPHLHGWEISCFSAFHSQWGIDPRI